MCKSICESHDKLKDASLPIPRTNMSQHDVFGCRIEISAAKVTGDQSVDGEVQYSTAIP